MRFYSVIQMVFGQLSVCPHRTLNMSEFTVGQFHGQAVIRHPDYMADPAKLPLNEQRFDADTVDRL